MTRSVIRSGVYVGALWACSFAVLCATAQAADAPGNYLVFFDFNKADLTADATAIVDQAAANAAAGKVTKIEVTGYTDTVGSDAYNLRLSKRRAMSVQAELTKQGISADEIAVEGKGEARSVGPGDRRRGEGTAKPSRVDRLCRAGGCRRGARTGRRGSRSRGADQQRHDDARDERSVDRQSQSGQL